VPSKGPGTQLSTVTAVVEGAAHVVATAAKSPPSPLPVFILCHTLHCLRTPAHPAWPGAVTYHAVLAHTCLCECSKTALLHARVFLFLFLFLFILPALSCHCSLVFVPFAQDAALHAPPCLL
jgi:hypothetical protein